MMWLEPVSKHLSVREKACEHRQAPSPRPSPRGSGSEPLVCTRLHLAEKEFAVRRFLITAALGMSLIFGATIASATADDCPRYLVIQPMYGGQATAMPAHAYAYGWFGATSSSCSSWHRTYDGTGFWWTFNPCR
jgi:hypothetical protein